MVFLCPFFERNIHMDADFLTQFMTWALGSLPGDIAANIVVIITGIVTLCTLVMRFWKEPKEGTTAHKIWGILHTLASFKKPAKNQ